MQIRTAKTAGFCIGAQRAVEMIHDLAGNKEHAPLYTFGPLIHNPQVLEPLRRRGIRILDHIPRQGRGTVLIRAHGIPPEIAEQLQRAGFQVRDATCRRVAKIQHIIADHTRNGEEAIICLPAVPDRGHHRGRTQFDP